MTPKSKTALYVVVVRCGHLGSYLASSLSRAGHSVVAIDADESAFRILSDQHSFRVSGDAAEFAILKNVKADEADLLMATTGNDNVNLMIAQAAGKVLGVRRVIARVFEPRKEKVCRKLGIETVCPTVIAGDELLRSVGCGAWQGRHVGHEGEGI